MPQPTRRALLASPALLLPASARAQSFPDRPIRMIVPFPPGGAADFLGRVAADPMAKTLGQPIQIENRTGAGGNIGTALAAQAERDGHSILLNGLPYAVNRFLYPSLPYDPDRDFTPLAMLAVVPNIMVVSNDLPVRSVAEFVALAKGKAAHYASIGNGTSLHLAGAQFALAAGLDMTHVPYRETAAANSDVMSGRVEVMFQTISAAAGLVKGGRMKALAVTSAERVPAFPEVPTLKEAGVDLVSVGWFGLFAPRGVPPDRAAKLEAATVAAVNDPAVNARILETGSLPRPLPGAEFGRFIAEESARMGATIRATGIRAD
ncbi:Bug family tripartite tricarboxylate transporter substrate binding protein [Pararoseomonas indoligenes]|uniref:Tripartite tricarboxylate transporter substrate binding protein n=1 Tax=Roseomonas indoligenes TaxID=2820811 RepID=A0A940MQX4_9PROT|nr:tripartite tricarboxylate transporter substrate binding protein [Pararoseomonas indoligenes]MBP0492378.1 tripartite tricarboxylate transporter substrate binding protein [Pararoseomonas indoligenes]